MMMGALLLTLESFVVEIIVCHQSVYIFFGDAECRGSGPGFRDGFKIQR